MKRNFWIFLVISAILILGINQTVNAQSATSITDVLTQTMEEQKNLKINHKQLRDNHKGGGLD